MEFQLVFADETLELPETKATVHRYPFIRVSKSIDRLSIGTVALATMLESLLGIKRAGADMILTYFAIEAAEALIS